mgnify:CR=1 FL=1
MVRNFILPRIKIIGPKINTIDIIAYLRTMFSKNSIKPILKGYKEQESKSIHIKYEGIFISKTLKILEKIIFIKSKIK